MEKYEIEVSFGIRKAGTWSGIRTESVEFTGTLEMLRALDVDNALSSVFHHTIVGQMARENKEDADQAAVIEAWMDSDEPKTYDRVREELGLERLA